MAVHGKLTGAALAAALALGVAACGGGSGGGPDPANTPAAKERAEAVADALEAAQHTGSDGAFADAHAVVPTVTAANDGTAVAIAVTETGGSRTGAFAAGEDGPARIAGWTGARFGRGASAEALVVYADIGAPEAMPFTPENLNRLKEVSGLSGDTVPASGLSVVAAWYPLVRSTSLRPADPRGSVTYGTTGSGADEGRAFAGTLAGGAGDYRCSGGACSVTLDDRGVATAMGGDWIFDPAEGATVLVPDYAHVYFGWWLNERADGPFAFQSFAGASDLAPGAVTAAMAGSATYRGAAAGVWATEAVSGGRVVSASSGEFTADAVLTAHFFGARDAGEIGGEIGGFRDAAGRRLGGWRVTLEAAALTDGRSTFSGATGGTVGSGSSGSGSWEGTFHGSDGAETGARPSHVTGRFDLHFPGTHIAGALGGKR